MADNPAAPFHRPSPRQGPSSVSTLWTMVLGWALIRLVVGRNRAPGSSPDHRGTTAQREGGSSESGFEDKQHAPAGAAQEHGRGRHAETPAQIPATGWKDVLWRTYEEFGKDRVMAVAAGVTYYALLAVFPAIAALVSIYGIFADPATIEGHLNTLSGVLPGGALDILR